MGQVREFWGRSSLRAVAPGEWVPAAPFRAHLRELLAIGDLSLDELAELVRVSRNAARRLVHGRHDGRPVRRISPDLARRLLRVRAADVVDLDRLVPSALMVEALVDLVNAIGRIEAVAEWVGVNADDLWPIVHGATSCRLRLVVQVRAAAEDLMADQFRRGQQWSGSSTGAAA